MKIIESFIKPLSSSLTWVSSPFLFSPSKKSMYGSLGRGWAAALGITHKNVDQNTRPFYEIFRKVLDWNRKQNITSA